MSEKNIIKCVVIHILILNKAFKVYFFLISQVFLIVVIYFLFIISFLFHAIILAIFSFIVSLANQTTVFLIEN